MIFGVFRLWCNGILGGLLPEIGFVMIGGLLYEVFLGVEVILLGL